MQLKSKHIFSKLNNISHIPQVTKESGDQTEASAGQRDGRSEPKIIENSITVSRISLSFSILPLQRRGVPQHGVSKHQLHNVASEFIINLSNLIICHSDSCPSQVWIKSQWDLPDEQRMREPGRKLARDLRGWVWIFTNFCAN